MRVSGVGPLPNEFLVVGSGPGFEEDRAGRAFVGNTGKELARFFNGVDLPHFRDVRATNLYRVWGGKHYRYTGEDLRRDEPELIAELQECLPRIIIPLGRDATRWFMGDVDMDAVQGLPFVLPETCDKYPCPPENVVVFPLVHPASAFHNPEMASYVVSGFGELARFLDGETQPRILFDDPYPEPHYEEITDHAVLAASMAGLTTGMPLAIDTEGWFGNPWSIQYSFRPGSAFLIHAKQRALLDTFAARLRRIRPRLVFHSALHDLGMARALGLDFGTCAYDDTMVMSYLLQIEPQGLKPLCVRHCNMAMQSYDEILGDASERLALDHLTWLWDAEQFDYEEACLAEFERRRTEVWTDKKGKLHEGRRISKVPALPKSALHKAIARCLQSKTPRKLWTDQVDDIQVAGYRRLGPLPEPTLDFVPRPRAIAYGGRDADGTTRLAPELGRRITAMDLGPTYELELGTYPLIDRMQRIGIKPDLDHFAQLSTRLGGEVVRLAGALATVTGRADFNANSGDQVAEYIFDTLGLEELKMTSSGRGSTNDKILEALEREHPEYPQLATIRSYRETYKLKNTFVDRLPDFVHRWPFDGRVHATFRTTRVVTGRLAASDPNILAQPEHGTFAPDFKRGWVADKGHVIGAWDESQVELRGLAHLSQDPVLLSVYRGEQRNPDGSLIDLHAKLAQRIFGGPISQYMVKCAGRLAAKAINFGIPMGMQCQGLSVELRKNGVEASEDDAQRWLDETNALYTGVQVYKDGMIAEARRTGYIRCLSGRIRYIGGIRSTNERVRAEAERFAFSTPIQESATFILKQAERIVYEDILVPFWREGRWIEPLVQIHDCLKLEMEEGMQFAVHQMMTEAMTNVPQGFSVPLAVEGEWGRNMKDMEAFT